MAASSRGGSAHLIFLVRRSGQHQASIQLKKWLRLSVAEEMNTASAQLLSTP